MRKQPILARDVQRYIASLVTDQGKDEGLRFGDPNAAVSGVLVAWMATPEAIRAATENALNLMVVHEALFYPYESLDKGGTPEFLTWQTNLRRLELLARHGITVIRAHGTLDQFCIFDDFAALLGLGEPVVVESGLIKVYEIAPVTLGELARRVRARTGMPGLRVTTGRQRGTAAARPAFYPSPASRNQGRPVGARAEDPLQSRYGQALAWRGRYPAGSWLPLGKGRMTPFTHRPSTCRLGRS